MSLTPSLVWVMVCIVAVTAVLSVRIKRIEDKLGLPHTVTLGEVFK